MILFLYLSLFICRSSALATHQVCRLFLAARLCYNCLHCSTGCRLHTAHSLHMPSALPGFLPAFLPSPLIISCLFLTLSLCPKNADMILLHPFPFLFPLFHPRYLFPSVCPNPNYSSNSLYNSQQRKNASSHTMSLVLPPQHQSTPSPQPWET